MDGYKTLCAQNLLKQAKEIQDTDPQEAEQLRRQAQTIEQQFISYEIYRDGPN